MTQRNCVFLYGPTRSGKTTVLIALENYFSVQGGVKVIRLNAEDLVIDMVKSIRKNSDTREFYHKFHDYDVLLVDNIWVLQGKPKTTEEIFSLFLTLADKGKLLIIVWDIPPAMLSYGTKAVAEMHEQSLTIEMKPFN